MTESFIRDENIEIFSDINLTPDGVYNKRIKFPTLTYLAQVFAMFENCNINLSVKILDESTTISLINNSWTDVPLNIVGNFAEFDVIPKNCEEGANLFLLAASFLERHNVAVGVDDINIHHRPEQGVSIMFDFAYAIDVARGCEVCLDKEVQIVDSTSRVMSITTKGSSNFFWRGHKLYCKLPLSESFRLKIRYKTALGWAEWSEILPFTCKRRK